MPTAALGTVRENRQAVDGRKACCGCAMLVPARRTGLAVPDPACLQRLPPESEAGSRKGLPPNFGSDRGGCLREPRQRLSADVVCFALP